MAKWFKKTFFIGGKAVEAEVQAGDITMYDRAGNIVQKFYPYHEETIEYDARGNPVHGRNSLGDDVWLEYDGNGMLVHVKGAITPLSSAKYERWYEYDDAGRLVRKKGYRIGETQYEYDGNGNLVHTKKDTFGSEVWYEYNADGNPSMQSSSNTAESSRSGASMTRQENVSAQRTASAGRHGTSMKRTAFSPARGLSVARKDGTARTAT